MLRFVDMLSDIEQFRGGNANVVHAPGLRLKAAHEAIVGATGAETEAAT